MVDAHNGHPSAIRTPLCTKACKVIPLRFATRFASRSRSGGNLMETMTVASRFLGAFFVAIETQPSLERKSLQADSPGATFTKSAREKPE
jgi:hypothetical protein